jgi:hypothetical protein
VLDGGRRERQEGRAHRSIRSRLRERLFAETRQLPIPNSQRPINLQLPTPKTPKTPKLRKLQKLHVLGVLGVGRCVLIGSWDLGVGN